MMTHIVTRSHNTHTSTGTTNPTRITHMTVTHFRTTRSHLQSRQEASSPFRRPPSRTQLSTQASQSISPNSHRFTKVLIMRFAKPISMPVATSSDSILIHNTTHIKLAAPTSMTVHSLQHLIRQLRIELPRTLKAIRADTGSMAAQVVTHTIVHITHVLTMAATEATLGMTRTTVPGRPPTLLRLE